MAKPKLIIVEGAIGSGKSTLSKLLRERIPHSTLLDLGSIQDDSKINSFTYHSTILSMLFDLRMVGSNFILSRSYLSNEIYSRLGKKKYDNDDNFTYFNERLKTLSLFYEVKVFILSSNPADFESRFDKRNKFQYVNHSTEEALKQQRQYLLIADELREKGIDVTVFNNSGFNANQLVDIVLSSI